MLESTCLYSLYAWFKCTDYNDTKWHGDGVGNTVEENSNNLLPNVNAIVAISKSMLSIKLCCN